jgi:hypothetical protein
MEVFEKFQLIPQNVVKYKWSRKVFVDLGANCGNSYLRLKNEGLVGSGGDWEEYLWEANPQMIKFFLNDLQKKDPQVTVVAAAAATFEGEVKFYLTAGQEDVNDKSQFFDKGV